MSNPNPTFPENIRSIHLIAFNTVKAYSVRPNKNIVQKRAAAPLKVTSPPLNMSVAALIPGSGDGTSSKGLTPVNTSFPTGESPSRFILFKEILKEQGINYLED